jgi:Tannase and feruloyl esterase
VDTVTDSKVKIEVWLPTEDQWNGRFLGIGDGGMESVLRQGYAVARANGDVHSMTGAAAVIVRNFYGRTAEHSYFADCSIGGVQALDEAEHFPGDFDGIVAGVSKKTAIPDLRPFQNHGGRLLVYEGSADVVAPPKANAEFFRLFLVPGLTHCTDLVGALDKWVSEGVAPEKTLNPSIARRIR